MRASVDGQTLRHVVDVRHESFMTPDYLALARRYGIEREDGIPLGSGRGEDLSNQVVRERERHEGDREDHPEVGGLLRREDDLERPALLSQDAVHVGNPPGS